MAVRWLYAELVSSEFGTTFCDATTAVGRLLPDDRFTALNRLGASGWEAYAVHTDGVSTRYFLKKPPTKRPAV